MSDWDDYKPRRKVEGGLKARSTRGAIGESWWSRRFIDVLESFAMGGRLTRGRTYARQGQVVSLQISAGVVSAKVQGSASKPYTVIIGLAPFSELIWAKVEVALAEQALFSAKLLSGEMPPGIDDVFAGAGSPLFPTRLGQLAMRCTCPDATVPCKHIAATFYLLAEAFDTDPFQILAWRGRDRAALLSRLRALRGDAPVAAAAKAPAAVAIGAALALAELTSAPITESVDRFWAAPVPLPPAPPTIETDRDLLLRQLPTPGPAIGGDELIDRLRSAYRRFGPAVADPTTEV